MKVLHVAVEVRIPGAHGGSTHVYEVSRHLARNHAVLTLAQQGSTAPGSLGIGKAPQRNSINRLRAFNYFFSCLQAVRRFSPDIIYERASSFGLGAMLSLALKRPLVTCILDGRHSRLSLWRAKRIVATDLMLIPQRFRSKGINVSWGVNAEIFYPRCPNPGLRAGLNLTEDIAVIAYTGSFTPWHGLQDIVTAAQLCDREIVFLLIGDGAEKANIETLVSSQNLQHRFRFTGAIPYARVPEYLALADICIAPFTPARHGDSSAEHLILDPLKLFEYQAMGKPLITIRSPNIARLLGPAYDSCLIPPGSPDALAGAIDRLLDDQALRLRISQIGLKQVRLQRTWAHHADQLGRIFEQLAERYPFAR